MSHLIWDESPSWSQKYAKVHRGRLLDEIWAAFARDWFLSVSDGKRNAFYRLGYYQNIHGVSVHWSIFISQKNYLLFLPSYFVVALVGKNLRSQCFTDFHTFCLKGTFDYKHAFIIKRNHNLDWLNLHCWRAWESAFTLIFYD